MALSNGINQNLMTTCNIRWNGTFDLVFVHCTFYYFLALGEKNFRLMKTITDEKNQTPEVHSGG